MPDAERLKGSSLTRLPFGSLPGEQTRHDAWIEVPHQGMAAGAFHRREGSMTEATDPRDSRRKFLGGPRTRSGWTSIGLAIGFCLLFPAWLAYSQATPKDRPTFFSDPIHAVLLLSAVASAISGLIVALVSIVRVRERSLALPAGGVASAFRG